MKAALTGLLTEDSERSWKIGRKFGSILLMCRKRARAATAQFITPRTLALGLASAAVLVASPALAFGSKPAAAPVPAAPAQAQGAAQTPAATPSTKKASPEVRAEAERLEPLARAAFWASQVDADPKDPEARLKLAASLRILTRYDEAAQAVDAVLVLQPQNVDALLEEARVALARAQGFYAIEPTRKVLQIAPKDWRAATLLAVALDQAQRPVEAMDAHKKAMEMAPDNAVVLSNAAMFYASQGDKAQAETLLRKAAARPDATLQVRQNLALVLGMQGKLAEAEKIEREDLPPKMAQANLDYFKAVGAH
jgi:Flp pilus assembly protein TadD